MHLSLFLQPSVGLRRWLSIVCQGGLRPRRFRPCLSGPSLSGALRVFDFGVSLVNSAWYREGQYLASTDVASSMGSRATGLGSFCHLHMLPTHIRSGDEDPRVCRKKSRRPRSVTLAGA